MENVGAFNSGEYLKKNKMGGARIRKFGHPREPEAKRLMNC